MKMFAQEKLLSCFQVYFAWDEYEIPDIKRGAIIEWESLIDENNEQHKHIGFALSTEDAISNSSILGTPQKHLIHKPSEAEREISHIYWHNKLIEE